MILAIHIGHDAAACLVGKDVRALGEERISRIKNFHGFPEAAICRLLELEGGSLSEVSRIIVTGTQLRLDQSYKVESIVAGRHEDYSNKISWAAQMAYLKSLVVRPTAYGQSLSSYFASRGFAGEVEYFDHHLCHIASSFATYPVEDAALLSVDGGGDGLNWSLYLRNAGQFERLATSASDQHGTVHDSPADVYANTTKFLGYSRIWHEGKLTGLAAYGEPLYLDFFRKLLRLEAGQFRCATSSVSVTRLQRLYQIGMMGLPYDFRMINLMRQQLTGARPADVACSLQRWLEEIMLSFVGRLSDKYDLKGKTLLLSGGLFANVLLNQRIKSLDMFPQVLVVPNMGDGGLPVGAAYLASSPTDRAEKFRPLTETMYIGQQYSDEEIEKAIRDAGLAFVVEEEKLADRAAAALASGAIVGLFTGAMEFGPRALGARSILVNPSWRDVNDTVNKRLRRTEFMPFAPVIRDMDAADLLVGWSAEKDDASFMTVTYDVSEKMSRLAPAVVHIDGTARPQVIHRRHNPIYYDILSRFSDRTGIPVLVNTSFNAHEEPIVMSPEDALRSYVDGTVDVLILQKYVVASPQLLERWFTGELCDLRENALERSE